MKQEHRQTIAVSARTCADVCTVASRQTHVSGPRHGIGTPNSDIRPWGMRDLCVSDPAVVV